MRVTASIWFGVTVFGALGVAACGNGSGDLPDGNRTLHIDARLDAGSDVVVDAPTAMADARAPADATTIDAAPAGSDAGIDASSNELSASWTPQFASLVGYWPLDGVAGSTPAYETTIAAVVGNDGTVVGNKTMTAVPSPLGDALEFDAHHTVDVIPTGTVQLAFTVQAWVRFESADEYTGSIFGTRAPADGSFDFKIDSPTLVHGDIGNGENFFAGAFDAADEFDLGVWHQIVYSVSATSYTIYHNGVVIGSGDFSGAPLLYDATHQIAIGDAYPTGGEQFGGDIDEIAIWNVALSDDDVATLYTTESAGTELSIASAPQFANIVGLWRFDLAVGPVADNAAIPAVVGNAGTVVLTNDSGTSSPLSFVAAQVKQGVQCPADANVISISPTGALADTFTVSLWVNPDESSYNNGSLMGTQYAGDAFDIQLNDDQTLHIDVGDGSSFTDSVDGSATLAPGSWHYVVFSTTAKSYSLYVDGALDTSGTLFANTGAITTPLLYQTGYNIYISNNDDQDDDSFQGAGDEIAIWNTALTADDVQSLFTHGSNGQAIDVSWTPQFASITNYWNFDASVTIADGDTVPAAIGPSGVMHGDGNLSLTPIAGLEGNALQFNGTNAITDPQTTTVSGSYSVQEWVKFDDVSEMNGQMIASHDPSINTPFDVNMDGNGVDLTVGDASNASNFNSIPMNFTAGAWHQAVFVITPTVYSAYMDGVLVWTVSPGVALLYDATHPIAVCDDNASYSDRPFDGDLDELAIWSKALSAQEVQAIYTRQTSAL